MILSQKINSSLVALKNHRLDRNRHGGGVILCVREDTPSKILTKHKLSKTIEAIFVEIDLQKTKFLVVGTYHTTHCEYGTTDTAYFKLHIVSRGQLILLILNYTL